MPAKNKSRIVKIIKINKYEPTLQDVIVAGSAFGVFIVIVNLTLRGLSLIDLNPLIACLILILAAMCLYFTKFLMPERLTGRIKEKVLDWISVCIIVLLFSIIAAMLFYVSIKFVIYMSK